MGSYSGNIGRPDRTRAAAGVIVVHLALAAIIIAGLNVPVIRHAVEQMTIITLADPPPPPPRAPPPARELQSPRPERARRPPGAPAKAAKPTEIVASRQKLPASNPVAAAPAVGTGSAARSGAALAGTGSGSRGTGTGPGGGGSGDFSRFTPPRLVRNLDRGDYQLIASGRLPAGSADVAITIAPGGTLGDCRLLRSSGDPAIDRALCPLLMQRLRFSPALDDQGRAIAYRTNYHARWQLGF